MPICRTCSNDTEDFYLRANGKPYLDCRPCYRKKDNQRQPAYYRKNRERLIAKARDWREALRAEVLAAYGGACDCCGEDEPAFLALDHRDGGGNQHRKELNPSKRGSAYQLYQVVKKAGFPPKYRLLCHNCNVATGLYGQCPHQIKEAVFI